MYILFDSSIPIPLLGTYSAKILANIHKDIYTKLFLEDLLVIGKN